MSQDALFCSARASTGLAVFRDDEAAAFWEREAAWQEAARQRSLAGARKGKRKRPATSRSSAYARAVR